MKLLRILLLAFLLLLVHTALQAEFSLPDSKLTPGVVAITDKTKVCGIAWGKDVRHVTDKMKKDVCLAYGIRKGCPGRGIEIDHLVSKELGGKDDLKNLWPQKISEARIKDRLENKLHQLVCAGKMPLKEAQEKIAKNWVAFYREIFGENP